MSAVATVEREAEAGPRTRVRDDRRPSMARLTKVELRKMFDTRSGFWLPICVGNSISAKSTTTFLEEAGRIVIEPVRRKEYNLDELLKGITPKNQHESVDFGLPSGKEVR